MDTYGEIYTVTCLVNGKQYVGQTTRGVKLRWEGHKKRSAERVSLLTRAIAKYGSDKFVVAVVDTASNQGELDTKECAWIANLATMSPTGYNLTTGGKGGKMSPEAIEKNRQAQLGRKRTQESIEKFRLTTIGRKQSPEHVEKVRAYHLGRKRSPETKEKMSAKAIARGGGSKESIEAMRQANLGLAKSDEVRAKMSASMKGKKRSVESRKRMSLAKLNMTQATKDKLSLAARNRKPTKRTPEVRERMRLAAIEAHRVRREKKMGGGS